VSGPRFWGGWFIVLILWTVAIAIALNGLGVALRAFGLGG